MGLKGAIGNGFGNERAEWWVQAARFIEKNAAVLRHGCLVLKEILQAGQASLAWMHALHGLRKLHLIADKNDVPGSTCHGDEVAKRYLSCFIDEQIVVGPALVFAAEMKYRATHKPMLPRSFFPVKNGPDFQ